VVVEIAEAIGEQGGVYGCRMTGGGFGGCCVALVKASAVDAIAKSIAADYKVISSSWRSVKMIAFPNTICSTAALSGSG